MFKYFKIVLIIVSMAAIAYERPVFSESVGTIEDNKVSWYAIIGTENKGKKLYVKGDIFSSDENPARYLRIAEIKKDALLLEDVASKNGIVLKPGERIPLEDINMIFEKTVESAALEYNYNKPGKRFTRNQLEDFTIKSLEKKRIVLEKDYEEPAHAKQLSSKEKEIFNSPRDKSADKKIIITKLFDEIESKKTGDNTWTLDSNSAEPAMRNAGSAIMSAIKRIEPGYRLGEGPSLKFNTDLGTVLVNKQGFVVQNIAVAKLTDNFGIRQGDVIKSINGYSVNSLLGIYRAYENITSNSRTKLVSVDIMRGGKQKTLVYKIR
ncbi:MAG: hypothetical protein Q8N76_05075 [Candidatus Omnitrophota bacterium]|nr:hypothetical protein [Candidatus Omnitrophota bacterium]